MKNAKTTFFQIVGLISLGLFLIVLFTMAPIWNEDHIKTRLSPSFEEFHGVTRAKYPDKTTRDAVFTEIIARKDLIVKDSSWPLVDCKAKFLIRNPGTIHRKDTEEVSCSWGSF